MLSENLTIINKLGLHARAAAKLVKTASGFSSQIHLTVDLQQVNAKSIMDIMMLAATQGTKVSLRVEGNDEDEALTAISTLINERFGEEE